MSTYTPNIDLLKKDPVTEGSDHFNIGTMMNDNWDKIDAFVALVAASIAPAYSSSSAYALGAYCTHGGKLWRCTTAIGAGGETWTEAHWTAVDAASLIASLQTAVPSPYTSNPAGNGTASPGSSADYSRGDHIHPTDTSRAPTSHAASADTYGKGTSSNYGHLKLSDSTTSTSSTSGGTAATPAAVKAVNDRITYGSSDLTAGTSSLTTGVFYAYYT